MKKPTPLAILIVVVFTLLILGVIVYSAATAPSPFSSSPASYANAPTSRPKVTPSFVPTSGTSVAYWEENRPKATPTLDLSYPEQYITYSGGIYDQDSQIFDPTAGLFCLLENDQTFLLAFRKAEGETPSTIQICGYMKDGIYVYVTIKDFSGNQISVAEENGLYAVTIGHTSPKFESAWFGEWYPGIQTYTEFRVWETHIEEAISRGEVVYPMGPGNLPNEAAIATFWHVAP